MDEVNDSATAPAPGTVQNVDEEGHEIYQGASDYESDYEAEEDTLLKMPTLVITPTPTWSIIERGTNKGVPLLSDGRGYR